MVIKIMMRVVKYGLVVGCIFLSGCFSTKKAVENTPRSFDQVYDMGSPTIANQESYYQGGGVVVIPLVPGENIPANNEVNRAGLMVVKGVADGLRASDHYVFLMPEDADLSDVIIEGTIDEWIQPKNMTSDATKEAGLTVSIRMVDRYTDELIMNLTINKNMLAVPEAFDRMAYEIGQDIALHLTLSERGVKK